MSARRRDSPDKPSTPRAARSTARFKSAGIDSAELDARLLIGAALSLDLTGMITAAARTLTADEAQPPRNLRASPPRRRAGRAHPRHKEFWGLPLKLSPATLVPRPDTETVVELALEMLRGGGSQRSPAAHRRSRHRHRRDPAGAVVRIAGCTGIGTDISAEALQTAQRQCPQSRIFRPRGLYPLAIIAAALSGPFDLIVSNPPYIRTSDIAGLAPEVRDHDPRLALDGGADGLEAYRVLIAQGPVCWPPAPLWL